MRLSEDIDFTTLTWVKGELDETLKQARHALEAYVEDPSDVSQMRFCATYLHQVQGTLRMVELYGAAMVTEEMEHLATVLLEQGVQDREEAYTVLMRGIVQLPDYLERLQSGHRDIPIVLLPLLNELRGARGEKGLSESVLFTPDLSRPLPDSAGGPSHAWPELELRQMAEQLRAQFQIALLKWFRNEDSDADVEQLTRICDRLVTITAQEEARRLFWVAAGVLEALNAKAFEPSAQLRQTIGKVEREIKRLADAGEASFRVDPPRELTRNLLYFVAHAPTDHGRIDEMREVFGLNALLPSEAELEHARGAMTGHNRALLDTVAGAIKEDLLRVKDALDLYMRSHEAEPGQLSSQTEALDRVADTLGMLGLGVARRVVQEQRTTIDQVVSGTRTGDESTLLDIAGALLYVDATLDDQVQRLGGEPEKSEGTIPQAEARRVLEAVVKEAQANFGQAKQCFVAFVESNWDHVQLQDVPRLLEEVAGALRILEIDDAPGYLQAICVFTEAELLARHRVPNGEQMDMLADVLAGLEYYLEAVRDHRPNRDQVLAVARDRLERLGYWPIPDVPTLVPARARAEVPVEVEEAETGPDAVDALPGTAEEEPAAAPETAPAPAPGLEPVVAATRAADAGTRGFETASDDIDEEIREVFIEEVQEEIAHLAQLLPEWKARPDDLEQLKPIRRVFHTLKGSGRLVGALTLGEFSWKVENMLNRVLDGSIEVGAAATALVEHAHAALPSLLSALRGEGAPSEELEGIKAVADRIAAGEQAWFTPGAAEPVPATAQEEAAEAPESIEPAQAEAEAPVEAAGEVQAPEPQPVSVDPVLFEILKAEVAGHLETVEAYLDASAPEPQPATDALLRAVHTMNGAFAMTEIPGITEVISPWEGYLKRLMPLQGTPAPHAIEMMREAVAAIRTVMVELERERPALPDVSDLAGRLLAERDTLPEPVGPSIPVHLETEEAHELEHEPVDLEHARVELTEAVDLSGFEAEMPEAPGVDLEPVEAEGPGEIDLPEREAPTTADLEMPAAIEQAPEAEPPVEFEREPGAPVAFDAPEVEAFEAAEEDAFESEVLALGDLDSAPTELEPNEFELVEGEFEALDERAGAELEASAAEPESAGMATAPELPAELEPAASDESDEAPRDAGIEALIRAYEHEQPPAATAEEVEVGPMAEVGADAETGMPAEPVPDFGGSEGATGAADEMADEIAEEIAEEFSEEFSEEVSEALAFEIDAQALQAEQAMAAQAPEEVQRTAEEAQAEVEMPTEEAEAAPEMAGPEPGEPVSVGEEAALEPEEAEEAEAGEEAMATESELAAEESAAQEAAEEAAEEVAEALAAAAAAAAIDVDPDLPLDTSDLDQDLLDLFLEESGDLLDHSDGLLASLRDSPTDRELVVGLQRDLHTLKGGARMAGLPQIGDLGHGMESLLEAVADGNRELGPGALEVLERSFDRLHAMVTRVGQRLAIAMPATLISQVEGLVRGEISDARAGAAVGQVAAEPVPLPPELSEPLPEIEDEVAEIARAPQEQIRIRADLLDRLVNYAGEVAIYRARLEQQLGAFRGALTEFEQTNTRLREQLRRLDIETEAQIIARYQREADVGESTFDPLELDRFSTLQQLSRALGESSADLVNLQITLDDQTRQYETLLLQQSRVSSDLQEGLMRTRMVPFESLVPRLRRILRQTSGELGKKAQLKVEGAQGEMDRNVLDRMTAPLEHMLRNALAHGLETPKQRRKGHKAEEGTVRIHVAREASEVVIRVSDDGRGMDRDAIRRKAIERGLMKPDAKLSDRDLFGFVLETGFSTALEVSKIAGRGVGMDVVHSEIKQLGGSLFIESERGKGTEFHIRLPFTLAVTQAVFIQLGETSFSVPISSVEGVSRISREDLTRQLDTGDPKFEYAGEDYQIYDLGLLLGQGHVRAEESLQVPVMLARSGDLRAAILVDEVVGSREIVVKPTGPQISSIPGIFGATVMGDGSVVVILDVAPLVRRTAALRKSGEAPVLPVEQEVRRVPLVMVVDDSITMRKVTGRVLERHNYEVMTAKDGVDAIEKLGERVPDVMLLDIEMPRMDGYELATHMRNDARLKRVPIIMITSRTGEKHRQRAFEIGVDRYLGKPYQEAELMRNVVEILEGGRGRSG
ncbi:MAG TPA: Hpt domain-containing protein [Xanthomonadaceae bacterium]|nr:Hpt domain-containing protein [Xanthomonadaceae bacterium]